MKNTLCGLLLLLCFGATAQRSLRTRSSINSYELAVGINATALANSDRLVMPGVEWRFADHWALMGEGGVVAGSDYIRRNNKAGGFALRPAMRFYFHGDGGRGYLQAQLQYRWVRYRLHEWLGKDCVNGVPAYEQLQHFRFDKQQFGTALVAGVTENLGPKFHLDLSIGFGTQLRQQKIPDEPNCCLISNSELFDGRTEQGKKWIPIMPIGIRLWYVVK